MDMVGGQHIGRGFCVLLCFCVYFAVFRCCFFSDPIVFLFFWFYCLSTPFLSSSSPPLFLPLPLDHPPHFSLQLLSPSLIFDLFPIISALSSPLFFLLFSFSPPLFFPLFSS